MKKIFFKWIGLFCILQASSPKSAYSWGHFPIQTYPSTEKSLLIHPILEKHEIRYCYWIHPKEGTLSEEAVRLQIEAALRVWLKPFATLDPVPVKLEGAPCAADLSKINLLIEIGTPANPTLLGFSKQKRAFTYPVSQGQNFFPYMVIDPSEYTDFSKLIPAGSSLKETLDFFASRSASISFFSDKNGLDYHSVYESTYRALLHEMGHAFGMCDTYPAGISDCDPAWLTHTQLQSSLMNHAGSFDLSQDDWDGMVAMHKRYVKN